MTTSDLAEQLIGDELVALVDHGDEGVITVVSDEMALEPLRQEGMASAEGQLTWENLMITIARHTIHREDNPGTPQHGYCVSKDRWFEIALNLTDGAGRLAVSNNLQVQATVVFESGAEVTAGPHEQLLLGVTNVTFIGGLAAFKIKINVLLC